MITRKRIGIDLDSTLNRLDLAWAAWIKQHDPNFEPHHWETWDVHNHTTMGHRVYDYLDIPGVFATFGVHTNARGVVGEIMKHHDVFIVTASKPSTHADKQAWLKEHLPMISDDNVIFCFRKEIVDVDVLIDDGPHNFKRAGVEPILFDGTWNRHVDLPRVRNWVEVLDLFKARGWLPK